MKGHLQAAGSALMLAVLIGWVAGCGKSVGTAPAEPPRLAPASGFDQAPGASVPLDAMFREETGMALTLGDLVRDRRCKARQADDLQLQRHGKRRL